jgi:hypothetical protein
LSFHYSQGFDALKLLALRNPGLDSAALSAARLLPVAHKDRNFSDALIWSFLAPDDGNDLIQQVYLHWVLFTCLINLDQRGSESIEVPYDRAPLVL